jgi:hypothetical protein
VSAYERAQTNECKSYIRDLACGLFIQNRELSDQSDLNKLYEAQSSNKCLNYVKDEKEPNASNLCLSRHQVSVIVAKEASSSVGNSSNQSSIAKYNHVKASRVELCTGICLGWHQKKLALYNRHYSDCYCLNSLENSSLSDLAECSELDSSNKIDLFRVYETGFKGKPTNN